MRLFDPVRATPLGALIKTVFMKLARVDAAVVGHPKCGNTWYGVLIRHLLIKKYDLTYSKMGRLFLSDLGAWPFGKLAAEIPRIYQSHCMPFPNEAGLRGMKESLAPLSNVPMIVLIRDPKDALVSYYMHIVYRDTLPQFSGAIADFIRSPVFGISKYVDYYNLLAECRVRTAPTCIRSYEDLWHDALAALSHDISFIGVDDADRELLARVIELSSFENMRRMESSTPTTDPLKVPGLFRSPNAHPEAYKVRKGGIGNWRKHVSAEDGIYIDEYVRRNLSEYYIKKKL